jgi:hypothetical protein
MNPREFTSLVFLTIFYLVLQILILRHFVLFDVAFCFIYIAAILILPFETNVSLVLLISFGLGIVVDLFYNTAGLHAAASVFVGFVRTPILKAVKGLDTDINLSLKGMGFVTFTQYALPLVFIHHLLLFLIEANNSQIIFYTLLKVIASTLFSYLFIVLFQSFRK